MGLPNDFISYGIHSICPYNRTTKQPYGILKIVGGGTISLSAEYEDLFGGSNQYAWASEPKNISSSFSATVKSFPDFLFELFLGAEVTTTAASATGTISALTNKKGTSVNDATTGIDDVTLKASSEADLKSGIYVIIAADPTTVNVYCLTDVDFARGSDLEYVDETLKINASPLTITASSAVEIPNTGLELNGGSGTIGMTAGDTAYFSVAAPHGGVSEIVVGKAGSVFPEHGQVCLSAKRSDGSLMEIEIYKAVGAGFPIALEETTFSIPELEVKLLYDSVLNKIASFRKISGV